MSEDLASDISGSQTPRSSLQRFTSARVGLERSGAGIATGEHLRFRLDHALARDAVQAKLDIAQLLEGLRERGKIALALESAAEPGSGDSEGTGHNDRRLYLRRPDLGRRLNPESARALEDVATQANAILDLAFVLADGLSALAVERHALPLLDAIDAALPGQSWTAAPVCVVTQARVAIGDEIGSLLRAKLVVLLIGERPGLSAPDSLGVYLTWNPAIGRTDAERNCISNIRPEGLAYVEAARHVVSYLEEARRLQYTGFALKQQPLRTLGEVEPRRTPSSA